MLSVYLMRYEKYFIITLLSLKKAIAKKKLKIIKLVIAYLIIVAITLEKKKELLI